MKIINLLLTVLVLIAFCKFIKADTQEEWISFIGFILVMIYFKIMNIEEALHDRNSTDKS